MGGRRSAFCALLALCFCAAPAHAQQVNTRTVVRPAAPSPRSGEALSEPGFWERLRAEARRFRELNTRPFAYALRYSISHDLARSIHDAARNEGVDPELAFRLVRVESNFNPQARSYAGALGLTQLMPGTAAGLGVSDVQDPAQAIEGGAKYLKQQLDAFGGDVAKALAAYNAGPNAVRTYGGVPPYAETQAYVQKVMGYAEGYRTQGATAPTAAPLTAATATAPAAPIASAGLAASPLLVGAVQAQTSAASSSMGYSTL